MTNPVFHAQCTTLEAALRDLPYVFFVDALPTQSRPNETTVIVDVSVEYVTISQVCEILGLIRQHLGEQKYFDLELGRSTLCISSVQFNPEARVGVFGGSVA